MTEHGITQTPAVGMVSSGVLPSSRRLRGSGQGDEDDDEFDGFFRKEYARVVKVVMYAGATFEEAEDAVSAAMARAYACWPLLTQPDAWVRMVALHNYFKAVTARCSRTCPQPQGRASPQVRTLDLSAGPQYDQSLELSLAHRRPGTTAQFAAGDTFGSTGPRPGAIGIDAGPRFGTSEGPLSTTTPLSIRRGEHQSKICRRAAQTT